MSIDLASSIGSSEQMVARPQDASINAAKQQRSEGLPPADTLGIAKRKGEQRSENSNRAVAVRCCVVLHDAQGSTRFVCRYPDCGKEYASRDAVRKHCRLRHLEWLRQQETAAVSEEEHILVERTLPVSSAPVTSKPAPTPAPAPPTSAAPPPVPAKTEEPPSQNEVTDTPALRAKWEKAAFPALSPGLQPLPAAFELLDPNQELLCGDVSKPPPSTMLAPINPVQVGRVPSFIMPSPMAAGAPACSPADVMAPFTLGSAGEAKTNLLETSSSLLLGSGLA